MKKQIVALLLLISVLLNGCQFSGVQGNSTVPEENSTTEEVPVEQRVSVLCTGDNLIHGAIYMQAHARGNYSSYDFDYLYKNVSSFINNYNLCYINQETLINNVYEPSTYPTFSSPPELGSYLYNMGFRVFSISNNHTYDKGAGGIEATLSYWESMPNDVLVTGLYTNVDSYINIPLYEKDGIVFAFLAYTEHTNGLPTPANASAHVIYTNNEEVLEQQIKLANELADVVVVLPHWGVENSHTVSDAQRMLAQKMCNWGADVIVGTHPHVLQDIEWLTNEATNENTLIIYSLGNFVSAQSTPDNLIGGFFTFDVVKNETGIQIENVLFTPVITHYGYNYSNITAYLYTDYSEELAYAHGVRSEYSYFNYSYIETVVRNTISDEYLHF